MLRKNILNFSKFIRKVFNEHDISKLNININKTQLKILMVVDDNSKKTMSEISEMAGIEKSTFSHSIEYLVANGFLIRGYSETNRRIIILSLTAKGESAAKRIKDDFDNYLESLISCFSAKEKSEFSQLVNSTSEYISKILQEMNK